MKVSIFVVSTMVNCRNIERIEKGIAWRRSKTAGRDLSAQNGDVDLQLALPRYHTFGLFPGNSTDFITYAGLIRPNNKSLNLLSRRARAHLRAWASVR